MRITGIATQGRAYGSQYTTTYNIRYKVDGHQSFKEITDDEGNIKVSSLVCFGESFDQVLVE